MITILDDYIVKGLFLDIGHKHIRVSGEITLFE